MSFDEAYQRIQSKQPPILYLTGKTCTGKSTFSNRLHDTSGYEIIELDSVVIDAVIERFGLQSREGEVFASIYKTVDNPEWVEVFVSATRQRIQNLIAQGKKVIVDGAVANPGTIRRIFDGLPDVTFLYFHPQLGSADYLRNLTNRFQQSTAQNRNGLPDNFWRCIDPEAFDRYCQDRTITPGLNRGIEQYAELSSASSDERRKTLQVVFRSIAVIEI